jgi:arylsulfatase A-like enzyme
VDIAPTILARLGLAQPASWIGSSLTTGKIATYSYHQTGKNGLETKLEKKMVIAYSDTAIYKYIYTAGYAQQELYEIMTDPEEKINLCGAKPEVVGRLRAASVSKGQ